MRLFNESFLCKTASFLSAVFCRLPYGFNLAIARTIGGLMHCFMGRKRVVVEANLRTAFADQRSLEDIRRISRDVFKNFTSSFMDLLYLPKIKVLGFEKIVTLEGRENIDAALAKGKGCIFLAIHSGSWELASLVGSMSEHPYNVVANDQPKAPKLNEFLNDYRRLAGAKVIPAGTATRDILRALQANEIVSLVLDQGGKGGVAVEFFGKTASMSTGAIRLGLKYQTPVCPVWMERQPSGLHVLKVFPALKLESTDDWEKDVRDNIQRAVRIVEGLLRANPSEAMWFYKIYKYTTQADVLILDDGKMGHLRQSQAVEESLRAALSKINKKVRLKTLEVVFKSRWHQKLFAVYCWKAQFFSFLRKEEALKVFVKDSCYKNLLSFKPDYIISCGSQMAGISFILSKIWSVHPIHILKPGILFYRW
ncbi:MAG: lysophospholipid acyltransferase family protein, partial [Candidatus Omnitrophica bacterium]|nr:lysophospholipid acyltransferase family protein [Candidatus Omnitrophota bacterium]